MIASMTTRVFRLCLPPIVAVVAVACGADAPTPAQPPAGKRVDSATTGTIAGKISFEGTRPAVERIRMAGDPACVTEGGPNPQSDAVLISSAGELQNVFVYVKEGLDRAYTFDVPSQPVVLDQKGCQYTPRVLGVRVGQPFEVSNSDDTFHNVHALPTVNREFNQSMTTDGTRLRRTFMSPEVMVRVKCDVHGWMAAWVGVLAHPYFAVTGSDGTFTLTNVPAGSYTVEAWHERFGTRTAQVTVAAGQSPTVALTFTAN